MASRNGQLLLLDPLPFLCSLPLDLLRRRRVGVVNAANWIGTNFDDLSALAAVHDDGLSHLVAWLLGSRQLGACTVCFRLLDLQLQILIPSQGSALAGIPRRRNLDELRLGFQSLFHASVNLGSKTVGRSAGILTHVGEKKLVESGSLRTVGARTCFGNECLILLVKGRGRQL